MISFIGNFKNRHLNRDNKLMSGCLGLGQGHGEIRWLLKDTGFLLEMMKMF